MELFVQRADFDCGVACIEMIAAHHGWRFDAGVFCGQGASRSFTSPLARLMAIVRAAGLKPRFRRVSRVELSELAVPCILQWDQHHFVVLTGISDQHATILDPALGRRELGIEKMFSHFSGNAVELLSMPEGESPTVVSRLSMGNLPFCSTCGWVQGHGYLSTLEADAGWVHADDGGSGVWGDSRAGDSDPAAVLIAPQPADISRRARMEVRGLGFRYTSDGPWVLKDCNFSVAGSESVAIVGAPGSGKTTLAKLLLGMLHGTEGLIALDGWALERFDPNHYRRVVAGVMQNDHPMLGSVAESIAPHDRPVDWERVEQAARTAGIHEDISAMPLGYRTPVDDSRNALSGAQRQRLMLARALYGHPRIVVVDGVCDRWERACRGGASELIHEQVTRVTIAECPELVAHADRVLVLEGGRISRELSSSDTGPVSVTTVDEGADVG